MDISQPEVIEGARVDRLNEKFRPRFPAPAEAESAPAAAAPSLEDTMRAEGAKDEPSTSSPERDDAQA